MDCYLPPVVVAALLVELLRVGVPFLVAAGFETAGAAALDPLVLLAVPLSDAAAAGGGAGGAVLPAAAALDVAAPQLVGIGG